MNAAVYEGPCSLNIVDVPLKEIDDNELLIKVGACGICGTDFHIFNGEAPALPPVVIGHEYAGVVVKAGKHTGNFAEGTRIAVNPNIHCGYCSFCKYGKINQCENLKALGVTVNGGLAQYSVVPLTQAYIIPDDLSFEEAAFAEPLSCAVHGINQSSMQIGDSVIILGAGSIGLLMLQLSKIKGASPLIIVDPSKSKLETAKKLGADHCVDSSLKDIEEYVNNLTSGGAHLVIECAGNNEAAEMAIKFSRKGGCVLLFGLASSGSIMKINMQEIFHKEIAIKTSLLNPFTFETAVNLLSQKKVRVDLFNPNRIFLEKDNLEDLFAKKRDYSIIKNMFIPN